MLLNTRCIRLLSKKTQSVTTSHQAIPSTRHHILTMAACIAGDTFFLDNFALRQWEDHGFAGTRMTCDKIEFVERVHEQFKAHPRLLDGYADFCKHVIIPNEWGCTVGALPITDANVHLLRSGYLRRRPEELPVLARWFPADKVTAHEAKYLDIILYSREQMIKEYEALPLEGRSVVELPNVPWGIISIKAQDEDYETPMTPATHLRNALGKVEGGSGVPINREAYEASVAYWEMHGSIQ